MKVKKISAANVEASALPKLFDEEKIDFQPIQCVNWAAYPYKPKVSFRIAHTKDAVLLHFKVKEASVRAKYGEDNGAVWTDSCDDSEKLIISKISDNTYSVVHYEYYNGTWHSYATEKFTLNGNKLIPVDGDSEGFNVKLLSANSKQLVIEIKGKDEYGDIYNKMTYKRVWV